MRTVTPAQAYATLGLAPPVPPVEQDAWADLAAAEAALRGLRAQAAGVVQQADTALEALRAARSGAMAAVAVAARSSAEILVTVEMAAERLAVGEHTVRRLLDQHPECRRTFGRAVRVYWPALCRVIEREQEFPGDERRPFPRDMAARRARAAATTTTTDTAPGGAG